MVSVEVALWEVECCQPVPKVGQHVAWQLRWYPDAEGPAATVLPWSRTRAAVSGTGWLLVLEGVTAWSAGDGAPDPERPGGLHLEAHGGVPDDVARTRGVVRRVQLVERTYRRVGDRGWEPVPRGWRLRSLRSSHQLVTALEGGLRKEQSAFLVDVEVDPALSGDEPAP